MHTGPYLLLSVITVYGKMLTGSDTLAGMMASVFALSGLFARFLSAFLLDRYPIKKVLLGFTALMAAASGLYIFSSAYIQAFILRGIQGLAYGVTCTAMSTYIVRLLDPQDRLEGIGYSSLTANLANAFGPAAAYMLLGENVDQFKVLFTAVFISVLASFILMFFLKDSSESPSEKKEKSEKGSLKVLIVPFLIWAFMSFSMSSVSAFLSLSAIEKGFSGIGLYFTFNVVGLVFSRFTMKRILRITGETVMVTVMIILIALSLAGIGLVREVWQLYCIALPFGFANGCLAPLINTGMVNSLPDSKSGFANAVLFAAGDGGFIIGPTFWGVIAGLSGYTSVFLTAAVLCAAAALLYQFSHRKEKYND